MVENLAAHSNTNVAGGKIATEPDNASDNALQTPDTHKVFGRHLEQRQSQNNR